MQRIYHIVFNIYLNLCAHLVDDLFLHNKEDYLDTIYYLCKKRKDKIYSYLNHFAMELVRHNVIKMIGSNANEKESSQEIKRKKYNVYAMLSLRICLQKKRMS